MGPRKPKTLNCLRIYVPGLYRTRDAGSLPKGAPTTPPKNKQTRPNLTFQAKGMACCLVASCVNPVYGIKLLLKQIQAGQSSWAKKILTGAFPVRILFNLEFT